MHPVHPKFKLIHIATDSEVGIGSRIDGSDLKKYIFRGFTRGRIGPKIVVHDVDKNFNREFFPSVFPDYRIEEITDGN